MPGASTTMDLPSLIDDHWFTDTTKGDSLGGVFKQMVTKGVYWLLGFKKVIPREIEQWVKDEADAAFDDGAIADPSGVLLEKPGVVTRLAEEVRLRFNGTPSLTQSNLMLAGRYIREVLEGSKVRHVDRPKIFYKIRALVFTRSHYEREADQILNSAAALKAHDDGTGWGSVSWSWGVPAFRRRNVTPT